MTSDVAFLLSKGFVPIVRHNQDSFQFIEEEASKASAGILGEQIACHMLRSNISNAYAMRTMNRFFVGITDTLLQDLSFETIDFLSQRNVAEFFARRCDYRYDIKAPGPTRGSVEALPNLDATERARLTQSFDNPKTRLFNSIFMDGLCLFVLLHEIGHIKHNHFNLTMPGATFAELPEASATIADPVRLNKEREADTAAAVWRSQQIIRRVAAHPDAGLKDYLFGLACAFVGAILQLRRLAGQAGSGAASTTHPLPQERVLNIAFWFATVGSTEYKGFSAEQHLRFLYDITFMVDRTAQRLKWGKLEWKASHFNPYPFMNSD